MLGKFDGVCSVQGLDAVDLNLSAAQFDFISVHYYTSRHYSAQCFGLLCCTFVQNSTYQCSTNTQHSDNASSASSDLGVIQCIGQRQCIEQRQCSAEAVHWTKAGIPAS